MIPSLLEQCVFFFFSYVNGYEGNKKTHLKTWDNSLERSVKSRQGLLNDVSVFLKDYYTPISKGALFLLCVFYEIMTFITGEQCSLAPAAKSFLPLFNLDLPHHNKFSKQLFVWELLYCLRYMGFIFKDWQNNSERKETQNVVTFLS